MTDAIRTESLTKYYGPVVGVEHLDLRVAPGETYGFLGPNGAGKTTTIRVLLDLLRPTRGRALINGRDSRTDSRAVRAQVGYLPAEMPLYPEMTGRAFLDFLAALQPAPVDPKWRRQLFGRFAVGDVDLRRRLGTLSHGMRRKLGIIQALMGRAPVLILDEPTAGLDPLMIEAFAETVAELKHEGNTTIFLSSHVLSEVERLCDRIGIIRRGALARETSLNELRRDMPRRIRVTFTGAAPPLPSGHGFSPAEGVSASGNVWNVEWRGPLGDLLAAIDTATIADIEIEPFKLEDYVLGVYSEDA
jgi:ABC-2 type transport system ATP-binding protein